MSREMWEELQKMKQERNCWNCKFCDSECCMYKCKCLMLLHSKAKDCEHFILGEYNQDELEKTDYM